MGGGALLGRDAHEFGCAARPPLVGAHLPALTLLQRGDELVDVVLVGERETRATKGLRVVEG